MKRFLIPAIFSFALILFGIWWFSSSQVLKRRTQSLLTTLTLDEDGGKVGRQMRVYTLNSLLDSRVELRNETIKEVNGNFERAELESAFSWLCEHAKRTRFEAKTFNRINITGQHAEVTLTLNGIVELPASRPADGIYDVTFHWKKSDSGWRLTRANWREMN